MAYKNKNCLKCEVEYFPTSGHQACCPKCGIINKRKYHKKYDKKYRERNKEKIREYHKKWRGENQDYIKNYRKKYYPKHKKQLKEYHKNYRYENEDYKKLKREYEKNKRLHDKDYRIRSYLRTRLSNILKKYTKTGKICSSKEYGIDYKAIIEHLKPFPKDLENYEIHHKKPLFTFNFVNPDGSTNLEEVKKAWRPENHKWIIIKEHKEIHKNDRLK